MPEIHECPNCGFTWRHGQHGGHSCSSRLIQQRNEALAEVERLTQQVQFLRSERPMAKEVERLRQRERLCETMDQARKVSLIRAMQEICCTLGIDPEQSSPAEIVAAVTALADSAKKGGKWC